MAHPGGRPLKFEDIGELRKKINLYFETTPKDEWTITGLAIALDTFRKVLMDYESGKYDDDREFSNTIKKAKQKVENGYEMDLKKYGRSGTIFALKNFEWKDQASLDLSTLGDKINTFSNAQELEIAKRAIKDANNTADNPEKPETSN